MADWKLVVVWGFLALSAAARAERKIVVETRFCCRADFEFSEVEAYARKVLAALPGEYSSILIMAEAQRGKGFAGTSEIDAWWCRSNAVRIRESLSHAYLLKTPLGTGLHHWDFRTGRYRAVTLAGRDVYQEKLRGGSVAWLGDYRLEMPQVWLVSDTNLAGAEVLPFAREAVAMLGLKDADVYVRSDPYLWRPDNCGSLTVPLQWGARFVGEREMSSPLTVYCRIRAGNADADCRTFLSP